ncbi:hypothetical protein B484DRAFT_464462 [Ochromonadaceae sp. CCMP2298]|nr:hypothetical protein B484DRAFT_464462 [Ochromonadaceae sp. CCMP2298]
MDELRREVETIADLLKAQASYLERMKHTDPNYWLRLGFQQLQKDGYGSGFDALQSGSLHALEVHILAQVPAISKPDLQTFAAFGRFEMFLRDNVKQSGVDTPSARFLIANGIQMCLRIPGTNLAMMETGFKEVGGILTVITSAQFTEYQTAGASFNKKVEDRMNNKRPNSRFIKATTYVNAGATGSTAVPLIKHVISMTGKLVSPMHVFSDSASFCADVSDLTDTECTSLVSRMNASHWNVEDIPQAEADAMMNAEINNKPASATASKATMKKRDKRNAKAAADTKTTDLKNINKFCREFVLPLYEDEYVIAEILEEVREMARLKGFVVNEDEDGNVKVSKVAAGINLANIMQFHAKYVRPLDQMIDEHEAALKEAQDAAKLSGYDVNEDMDGKFTISKTDVSDEIFQQYLDAVKLAVLD